MNTKMYVGNLPFSASDAELRELFAQYGDVTDVHLPMDREMGRPRGFAFVTMSSPDEAKAAIAAVHGTKVGSRDLTVNEARPREERAPGGGGGYGGGGGDRGGRSYGGGGGGGGGYGGGDRGGDRGGERRERRY